MPLINALPPEEIEKIAAGEVVERPVSVVKELIENSLDAGAKEISVEIEDGGKRMIRVIDDGVGIPFEELPLAVKNFHTSKIKVCEDIYHQTTLGFRGEALAAICAVSRTRVCSRYYAEQVGGELVAEGGKVLSVKPLALNQGTSVEVRDLFFNTPVRKKFLRSRATETFHISNLVRNYILAFEDVAFRLKSEGRTIYETKGEGLTQENLARIFGEEIAAKLVPFEREYPPLGIGGLVGPPSLFSEERKQQFFFVNRRPVKNRLLFRAADDAFREFVSPNRYPPLVLRIVIPPEEVDVNIHPTKSEVSFMHQEQVYSAIIVALKEVLRELSGLDAGSRLRTSQYTGLGLSEERLTADEQPQGEAEVSTEGLRLVPTYEMGEPIVPEMTGKPAHGKIPIPFQLRESEEKSQLKLSEEETRSFSTTFPEEKILPYIGQSELPVYTDSKGKFFAFQLFETFIVIASKDELVLIDQHSAHERVIFEKLWSQLAGENPQASERQKLLFPIEIEALEPELIRERQHIIERLGFRIRVGKQGAVVEEAPKILLFGETAEKIPEIISELLTFVRSKKWDEEMKERLSRIACRSAIKAGDKLSSDELELIIHEFTRLGDFSTCPHGRPTVIRLGKDELSQLFLRS